MATLAEKMAANLNLSVLAKAETLKSVCGSLWGLW